jgi:hypothetical protein
MRYWAAAGWCAESTLACTGFSNRGAFAADAVLVVASLVERLHRRLGQTAEQSKSLGLSAQMGSFDDRSEYLLVETLCEYMSDLMLAGLVRVWSENRVFRGLVSATYRLL